MTRAAPGATWQRPEIAEAFVEDRRALIPMIDGQGELVRRLIVRGGRRVTRYLDLGAGGGAFAQLVMDAHTEATGVLVDFSEPMLAAAQRRLAGKEGRWEIVRGDLSSPRWQDGLPAAGEYDAMVSRLAIHHLPDERKRALYREAFELLSPGGLFLNWEHIETGGLAEGLFDEFFRERLLEAEREHDHPRTPDEVIASYDDAADEDILCDPETQCDWLRDIGFEQVDTYFKLPGLAIFGGIRPWNQ
jgi:tRNA (cmo5U34)-methyltransferase